MLYTLCDAASYDDGGTHGLFQRIDAIMEKLCASTQKLPRVAKDGSSECWFADEWYKEASDWRAELERQVRFLEKHYADARRAMKREKEKEREWRASDSVYASVHIDEHRAECAKHWQMGERIGAKIDEANKAFKAADAIVAERRAS